MVVVFPLLLLRTNMQKITMAVIKSIYFDIAKKKVSSSTLEVDLILKGFSS